MSSLNDYLGNLARSSRSLYDSQREARATTRRLVEHELTNILNELLDVQPRIGQIFETKSSKNEILSKSVLRVTHGVYIWRLYLKEPKHDDVIQVR